METELLRILGAEDTTVANAIQLAIRLGIAAAAGWIIAIVFRRSRPNASPRNDQAMFATLVLLTMLICLVTSVVGNSVARAFSLAGALSIVRFRTIVDDTRDTAFVIFAVVMGMAIGCGLFLIPLIGVPLVSAVSVFINDWSTTERFSSSSRSKLEAVSRANLRVRVALGVPLTEILEPFAAEFFSSCNCLGVETTKQGAAIEANYAIQFSKDLDPVTLISRLNKIEGIQTASLEIHETASR
jgi:hypothetical protein